jgi:hypothetical protein
MSCNAKSYLHLKKPNRIALARQVVAKIEETERYRRSEKKVHGIIWFTFSISLGVVQKSQK